MASNTSPVFIIPPTQNDFLNSLKIDLQKPVDQMPLPEQCEEFEKIARGIEFIRAQNAFQRVKMLKFALMACMEDNNANTPLDLFFKLISLPQGDTFKHLQSFGNLQKQSENDRDALRELESKLKTVRKEKPASKPVPSSQEDLQKLETELTATTEQLQKKEAARNELSKKIQDLKAKLNKGKGDKVLNKQKISRLQKEREPLNREIDSLNLAKKTIEPRLIEARRDAPLAQREVVVPDASESRLATIQKQITLLKGKIAECERKKEEIQTMFKQNFMVSKMDEYAAKLEERRNQLREAIQKPIYN